MSVNTLPVFRLDCFGRPESPLGIARRAQALRAVQKVGELQQLVGLVQQAKPRVVVEIGSDVGGSLYALCRASPADALVVSVDLPHGADFWLLPMMRNRARPGQQVEMIRGASDASATLVALTELLDGRPVDVLFIDGDHDLVASDWNTYLPFVRDGGIVALHDIMEGDNSGSVPAFWQTIKENYRSQELISAADDTFVGCGIGVIWKETA